MALEDKKAAVFGANMLVALAMPGVGNAQAVKPGTLNEIDCNKAAIVADNTLTLSRKAGYPPSSPFVNSLADWGENCKFPATVKGDSGNDPRVFDLYKDGLGSLTPPINLPKLGVRFEAQPTTPTSVATTKKPSGPTPSGTGG